MPGRPRRGSPGRGGPSVEGYTLPYRASSIDQKLPIDRRRQHFLVLLVAHDPTLITTRRPNGVKHMTRSEAGVSREPVRARDLRLHPVLIQEVG